MEKFIKEKSQKLEIALKIFLGIILFLALVKLCLVYGGNSKTEHKANNISIEDFAKCLSEKDTVMYGRDDCTYCQTQKKMFGSSFSEINYINCEFDKAECEKEAVNHYPVWSSQGEKFLGILTFDQLSDISKCPLPSEY